MLIQPVTLEQVWQLRHQVMWPDRELDYVKLKDDDQGRHYGLLVGGQLISVISLFIDHNEAQFRKFATLTDRQGKGYGSYLLSYVLQEVEQAGIRRIYCNARAEKTGFYSKFGLAPTEESFIRGDKQYVIMERFFPVSFDSFHSSSNSDA
ncbi:GNAT family N-acetyltransferase [Paenibacillus wulumuqiensis]|uniref:GNAT family N-acetyltransferase n=1 Tax=Paenibacillus wulumuqiensis TaxID=1567107 RepID=UPI000A58F729|nr:GNAT family N-acetyltransferase [Paenibacillus wulumuqiensis]